jgi:hypothetical protein
MERIQLSDEDFAEFERLGSEVSLVEMLEELPDDQREPLRAAGVDDDFYLVQPHLSGRAAGSTGSTTTATRGAAATSCCRADAWGVAEGSSRNSTHG